MILSANNLVRWVFKELVAAKLAVHNDITKCPLPYRKVLSVLCGLATQDVTLKRLKQETANLPYCKILGNTEAFAQAVWDGKKAYITHLKEEQERQLDSQDIVDDAPDSSTPNDSSTGGDVENSGLNGQLNSGEDSSDLQPPSTE